MIADRNYCYVWRVGITYNEEKINSIRKVSLIHNTYLEIKKDIQLCIDFYPIAMNFGCITIEKVIKRDLATVNDVISNIILMNTFIDFVGMTNNSSNHKKCLCPSWTYAEI